MQQLDAFIVRWISVWRTARALSSRVYFVQSEWWVDIKRKNKLKRVQSETISPRRIEILSSHAELNPEWLAHRIFIRGFVGRSIFEGDAHIPLPYILALAKKERERGRKVSCLPEAALCFLLPKIARTFCSIHCVTRQFASEMKILFDRNISLLYSQKFAKMNARELENYETDCEKCTSMYNNHGLRGYIFLFYKFCVFYLNEHRTIEKRRGTVTRELCLREISPKLQPFKSREDRSLNA